MFWELSPMDRASIAMIPVTCSNLHRGETQSGYNQAFKILDTHMTTTLVGRMRLFDRDAETQIEWQSATWPWRESDG